ncbi:unnamed protein product [Rotaria magnacalcarata]|uniref:Uncharacterized protein n=1 Tax=Rotaria magnacalcarata TaxID=392030 RepID=A0A8S3HKF1_9BILA|nr:unnamed protein product [Rotaria magnacalcarata]CAF5182187.1 unnamed protein product [Rotaria magnacalcarata]
MREVSLHRPAWTLESGLCCPDKDYDDPRYPLWKSIDALKLSDDEKYSLTLNGRPYAVNPDMCTSEEECISQYRIRDGFRDYVDEEDEKSPR